MNEGLDGYLDKQTMYKGAKISYPFIKGVGSSSIQMILDMMQNSLEGKGDLPNDYVPWKDESISEGSLMIFLSILKW